MKDSLTFHLDSFFGPLEFLIALVQSQELPIEGIHLKDILSQYLEKMRAETPLDTSAEFIASSSFLLWLKSKLLLPRHEQVFLSEEDLDPHFEIIHHLLDYCSFRAAAKAFIGKEQKEARCYFRGVEWVPPAKKKIGLDHLSLVDFASLCHLLLAKSAGQRGVIQEDRWKVSEKVAAIRNQLITSQKMVLDGIFLGELFASTIREECIVTFLAVLELMKSGEIHISTIEGAPQITNGQITKENNEL